MWPRSGRPPNGWFPNLEVSSEKEKDSRTLKIGWRCESMWKPLFNTVDLSYARASSVLARLLHRRRGPAGRFVPLLRSVQRPHRGGRSSTGAMLGPRRCARWRVGALGHEELLKRWDHSVERSQQVPGRNRLPGGCSRFLSSAAPRVMGRCEAASTAARLAGRSFAKHEGNRLGLT